MRKERGLFCVSKRGDANIAKSISDTLSLVHREIQLFFQFSGNSNLQELVKLQGEIPSNSYFKGDGSSASENVKSMGVS